MRDFLELGFAIDILAAGFLAFFVAGALIFPLLNDYYLNRVVFSLGLVGVMYGLESVVRAGHLTTCGLLSGNCEEHSVRIVGFLLWAAIAVFFRVRRRNRP